MYFIERSEEDVVAKQYRVLAGLDYPARGRGGERRAEPGEVVEDLPKTSVAWLLEQGAIEEVTDDGVRTQQAGPGAGQ
ncbi:hypothetical protein [Nonomuraea gerenzanensis]|uniref:hypothetical protein n=1 Tax=Nonomuraea gerenzanensis TaxID=93944 RepID=UPI001CD93AE7|nr:hypothetical protein [Nonomuraea gerenzanensis]UBU11604.1 hypothetical protein LCN96_46080 [Nonomuraea gerenzanensis]